MKNTKYVIARIGLSLCITMGLLCGCGSTQNNQPSKPEGSESAVISGVIGTKRTFSALAVNEYSAYMDQAFDCQIEQYDTFTQAAEELVNGNVDASVLPLTEVLRLQSENHSVKIVSNYFQQGGALVCAANSEIDSIDALLGKTVGYTEGSAEYVRMNLFLEREKMDSSQIKWRKMKDSELNDALSSGEIDAYCADIALAGTAIIEGYGKIIAYPFTDELGENNLVLVATEETIQKKRDWLQEVVDTNRTVIEMVASNQDWLNTKVLSMGIDESALEMEQGHFQWVWDMEEEYVVYTRNLASEMFANNMIDKMVDLNESFDFTFLEKTNEKYLS